jgi:hypothetical protein
MEVSEKITQLEINYWRVAHSKSATVQEAEEAAKRFFQSLRQRDGRYIVRRLGSESLMRQSDRREHGYNAGV